MIIKNYIPFVLCSLFAAPALGDSFQSGPYIGYAMSRNLGSADRPDVSVTHPVDFTHTSDHNFDFGRFLSVGYLSSRWYVEAGWTDLGALGRSSFQSGEDATFTFATSAKLEEEITGGEIKLGRWFSFTNRYAAYIEAGALRYSREVITDTITSQTEKLSGPSTVMASSASSTSKNTTAMYGIGLAVLASETSRVVLGVLRYGDIDRTSIRVGVQIGF
jgi:hypothetical protein